jgi:branched-subunit amino acid ABC-type transport system permease component
MDVISVIEAFIVVTIGGGGSVGGALLAALLVGLGDAFGILFLPRFAMTFVYALMIIVLIFRPQGLMGKGVD